ncbi:hypothetical protein D3C78_1829590 [compost metagenome]
MQVHHQLAEGVGLGSVALNRQQRGVAGPGCPAAAIAAVQRALVLDACHQPAVGEAGDAVHLGVEALLEAAAFQLVQPLFAGYPQAVAFGE